MAVKASTFRYVGIEENTEVFPILGECKEAEADCWRFDLRFTIPALFNPADALAVEADQTVQLSVMADGRCFLGTEQEPTTLPTDILFGHSSLEEWSAAA